MIPKRVILLLSLIALLLFCAMCCMADGYLIFLVRTNASQNDKQTIRQKLRQRFFDTSDIDVSSLGQEQLIANTNVVAWRLVVSMDQLANLQRRQDLPTRAEFETWKTNHLENPARFEIYYAGDGDWRRELDEHGLEPVPEQP